MTCTHCVVRNSRKQICFKGKQAKESLSRIGLKIHLKKGYSFSNSFEFYSLPNSRYKSYDNQNSNLNNAKLI